MDKFLDLGQNVVSSMTPIKSSDLTNTDMNTLPFSLTYGEENGPLLPTSSMTLDQFKESITGVNLNYSYVNLEKGSQADQSFMDDFAGYTGALGDKIVDTATNFYNTVSDGVGSALNLGNDFVNSLYYKIFLLLAIALVAIWIIAKSGILKQAAAFV